MRFTNKVVATVAAGTAISQIPLASAVPLERRGGGLAAFFTDLIGAMGRQGAAWIADAKYPPCESGSAAGGHGEVSAGEGNDGKPYESLWAASDSKNAVVCQ